MTNAGLFRGPLQFRQLLLQPTWKHILSYETRWMDRDAIADITYEAGFRLNRLKREVGLISVEKAEETEARIAEARALMGEIDGLNHYIGMRKLDEAAQFEKQVSIYGIIGVALLMLAAIFVHNWWAVLLVAIAGAGVAFAIGRFTTYAAAPATPAHADLNLGIMVNLLSPHPWVFWIGVGGPLLISYGAQGAGLAGLFLLGFYLLLIGSKVAIAAAAAGGRRLLDDAWYRRLLLASSVCKLPWRRAASSTITVPVVLARKLAVGSATDRGTEPSAARCTMASAPGPAWSSDV